jgi:hypothetical protein
MNAWSNAEGATLEALDVCFWLRFCDQQTVKGPKERAAFQIVLKRRPHLLLMASVSVQDNRQFVAVIAS